MKEETEDMQSFLDNFQNDIEKGSRTVVTLTADNVAALTGGDKAVQKILLDSANNDSDENEDEDMVFYLDDDSICRTQARSKPKQTLSVASKAAVPRVRRQAAVKANKGIKRPVKLMSSTASVPKKPKTRSVIILNKDKVEQEREDDDSKDADDGDDDKLPAKRGRVYNFEDNIADEEDALNEEDEDYVPPQKQIKTKNVASTSSGGGQFSCNHCNYRTNKKVMLQRHEKSHNDDRPFKCSICDRGFKTNVALVNHINVHMGNRPHKCKDCESAFTTSGELIRHVRYKHTGEKPHKCTECGYASVEMSKLHRHFRCHTGERPYQCPHCTYASPDTFKLKRHLRTHTGEKPYECDICKARFTQSNSLKSHRLIHSVMDKPVFQCTLCPTTCGRKADLRLHMQNLHQSDEPIECRRCGKELPDRYNYKLHVKTHVGERCFRCTLCAYASISQRHLDSHMLIHTDEKPFKCDFCDLVFRQPQLLKRHVNIYHNKDYVVPEPREKQHTCPHCERTFTHKGNLMRHMEVHDPLSNAAESKIALKRGRNVRIKPMGTAVDFSNVEDDSEDVNSKMDIIEYTGEDDLEDEIIVEEALASIEERRPKAKKEQKNRVKSAPVTLNKPMSGAKDVITFRIKQEPVKRDQGVLTVDVKGEDQYVVLEIVNDEDDEVEEDNDEDLDGDENIIETYIDDTSVEEDASPTSKTASSRIDAKNCFGFEADEEETYDDDDYDDVESKQFIQLLNI